MWRASPSLGAGAQVFTGAFPTDGYGALPTFCFDKDCDDAQPIQDDHRLQVSELSSAQAQLWSEMNHVPDVWFGLV